MTAPRPCQDRQQNKTPIGKTIIGNPVENYKSDQMVLCPDSFEGGAPHSTLEPAVVRK